MSRKDPYSCKSGSEFIRDFRGAEAITSERWAGDHCTWNTDEGHITICNSRRELPHGLRRRIAQTLVTLGIATLFVLFVASNWPMA